MSYAAMVRKKAAEGIAANPPKEGDYMRDGLLYCGKCQTPKWTKIPICDEQVTVFCACRCVREERERAEREFRERSRLERVRALRAEAFDSPLLRQSTFTVDDMPDSKISRICRNYVEKYDELSPKGLLLFGDVGTGKSFYAACMANALLDRGIPCRMTTFASLDKERDELGRYRVVILDDFGAQRDTEYMREIVWSVIDELYRRQTTLLCTTNLTAEALKNPADTHQKRVFSRLYEMCAFFEVKGKDRRRENMIADNARIKAMLDS